MKYELVIFDLDGTILDTLDDLADSTNVALQMHGFPVRTREEIRAFVGNGILNLMQKAVPIGTTEEKVKGRTMNGLQKTKFCEWAGS